MCVCLSTLRVPDALTRRGLWIPWNWSYSWLWAAMWLLGAEPGFSTRAASAREH